MYHNNKLAESYNMMRDLEKKLNLQGSQLPSLFLSFRQNAVDDQRRYNVPKANEITIVFQNVDGEPPFERDIRIYNKFSNETRQVSILHAKCDPMIYSLLYPFVDDG